MSARTCLLCGKTLVRIRVGAGGDFCSREHRNQHQLRRGMDRLAEANEVATLARRRETPKALFGEASPGSAALARRAFLDAVPFRIPEDRTPGLRWTPKAGRVTLLPPAVVLAQPLPDAAPRDVRRDFGRKFAAHAPAALPSGPSAAWKPAGLAAGDVRGLRAIELSAAPGNALRVSSSAGFRLRPPHSPALASAASTGGGIAGLRARAGSRPFALRQESLGAPAKTRLAFVDVGFSSAPDAPARLDWLAPDRDGIALERREL